MTKKFSDLPRITNLQQDDDLVVFRGTDAQPEKVANTSTLGTVLQPYVVQAETHATDAETAANNAVAVVTGGTAALTPEPGKIPLADANGEISPDWLGPQAATILRLGQVRFDDIGIMGAPGAGVGVASEVPDGMRPLEGTYVNGGTNWGNYVYDDGSQMVYIPAFYYKWTSVNFPEIRPISYYQDRAEAAADGWVLPLAFIVGGQIKKGVFVDKYLCSNNGGIASSLIMGNPLSSGAAHNPFSGLTGSPANSLAGAIAAAKTRGFNFFAAHHPIRFVLALLSLAHGLASQNSTYCAWYDSNGITNYPKGCNNNALGDVDDNTLVFVSDGYDNAAKTGSSNFPAKTSHNGQACGVMDVNGCMWEVSVGLTFDGTNLLVLSESADITQLTGGTTESTDLWSPTGYGTHYVNLGTTFGPMQGRSTAFRVGLSSQTFSGDTTGDWFLAANCGIPLDVNSSGTNLFGTDNFSDYMPTAMCPLASGDWSSSSGSGAWAFASGRSRSHSGVSSGFRSALYP